MPTHGDPKPKGRVLDAANSHLASALVIGALALAVLDVASGCGSTVQCYPGALISKGKQLATIPLGVEPSALQGGPGAVWVVSTKDNTLWEVAADGTTRGPYKVGESPSAIVDNSSCDRGERKWVALFGAGQVVEVDGRTGAVLRSVTVGTGPVALATSAWDNRALWVANQKSDSISRIDMITAAVTKTVSVGHGPRSLSLSPDSVYVANHDDGTISVVDARSGVVTKTIEVGHGPSSVGYDLGFISIDIPSKLWVANTDDETVERIDPGTNKVVRTWSVPGRPLMVIPIGVRAWVVVEKFGLIRLDDSPKQNLGDASVHGGSDPIAAINVDFDAGRDLLWIANASDHTLSRTWS